MYLPFTFEGLLKLMLVSLAITICIFTINAILGDTKPVTSVKEVIEQQQNNYIFKEDTLFTISGAVKIEEIGQMVDVEKLDENLNKTKTKEYQPLFTEGRYGGHVYRVTFQDGTTKRYYYQFSRTGDGEWLPLDFGPYKN